MKASRVRSLECVVRSGPNGATNYVFSQAASPGPTERGSVTRSKFVRTTRQAFTSPILRSGLLRVADPRSVTRDIADGPIAHTAGAFTLIELVIAASLASLILVAGYMCLSSATATQKLIEPRAEVIQNARVAMAILSADLRSACPLSADYQFLGMHRMIGDVEADNLDFATHNYNPSRPNEGDFCEESFFVQQDPNSGRFSLWRRRNPTIAPDPLAGGKMEEIADGLRGVRFEYYDGDDWYDDWGEIKPQRKQTETSELEPNMDGMPGAVRITLWFDPNPRAKRSDTQSSGETKSEPPLVFQTMARLNLADISQQNSSQTGSNTGNSNSSGQPQPGMQNGPN